MFSICVLKIAKTIIIKIIYAYVTHVYSGSYFNNINLKAKQEYNNIKNMNIIIMRTENSLDF